MGRILRPYLSFGTLYWHHWLRCDFTGSAKSRLGKQTSQLSLAKTLCMGSAWVWLLAGTIKWTLLCVTLWSVFQYPVTYALYSIVFLGTYSRWSECSQVTYWQMERSSVITNWSSCASISAQVVVPWARGSPHSWKLLVSSSMAGYRIQYGHLNSQDTCSP